MARRTSARRRRLAVGAYAESVGDDPPEIKNWVWPHATADGGLAREQGGVVTRRPAVDPTGGHKEAIAWQKNQVPRPG